MSRVIDRQSLAKYLFYGFIPAPVTIFKGVTKPLAKKYLLDYSSKLSWSQERFIQETETILLETTKKCLKKIKNYPLGIFLSGGLDSSLVTMMLSRLISRSKIIAFSICYQEKKYDESYYAKIVARKYGLEHQLITFFPHQAVSLLKQIINFLDEPMADPSLLPTYLAFAQARKKVKHAFLGDAGDENFAGYPKYLAHWFLLKTGLNKLPLFLLADLFSGKWKSFFHYAHYPLYLRNQFWVSVFSPRQVYELCGHKVVLADLEKYHRLFKGQDSLDEAFFLDQNLILPDLYLVKTSAAAKATSLKIHCPFSDKSMFKFSCQVPSSQKLKGFKTKSILRTMALKYFPKKLVMRPKTGFGLPLESWLKNELKPLVLKELNLQKIKKEGFFNSQAVAQTLANGTTQQIWTLLIFELWLKKWSEA